MRLDAGTGHNIVPENLPDPPPASRAAMRFDSASSALRERPQPLGVALVLDDQAFLLMLDGGLLVDLALAGRTQAAKLLLDASGLLALELDLRERALENDFRRLELLFGGCQRCGDVVVRLDDAAHELGARDQVVDVRRPQQDVQVEPRALFVAGLDTLCEQAALGLELTLCLVDVSLRARALRPQLQDLALKAERALGGLRDLGVERRGLLLQVVDLRIELLDLGREFLGSGLCGGRLLARGFRGIAVLGEVLTGHRERGRSGACDEAHCEQE